MGSRIEQKLRGRVLIILSLKIPATKSHTENFLNYTDSIINESAFSSFQKQHTVFISKEVIFIGIRKTQGSYLLSTI